jgi:hypothetical protein
MHWIFMIKKCKYIRLIFGIWLSLFVVSGCSAKEESKPIAQMVPTSLECSEYSKLLDALNTQKVFDQSSSEFLAANSALFKIKKPNIDQINEYKLRFELMPIEHFLLSGEMSYDKEESKEIFYKMELNLDPVCISAKEEKLKTAESILGTDFYDVQTGVDKSGLQRTWNWKEPDINFVRFLSLSIYKDKFQIRVHRDPAPDEGNGDEEAYQEGGEG